MACTGGQFRPYQFVLWRLCWNWGCQVQLSRVAKELMQFASSPSWVLDIYVRCDAAGWLVGWFIHSTYLFCRDPREVVYPRPTFVEEIIILPSHLESPLITPNTASECVACCFVFGMSWVRTPAVLSEIPRGWNPPLPLPPDCQSVWYCSSRCVYVCPPTGVHRSRAPCLGG